MKTVVRLQVLLLASAGVLLGHTVGYGIAHPAHASREAALGGHAYMGPMAAVVVPMGLVALLLLAARSIRRSGNPLPNARTLAGYQVALFLVQEFAERIPGPASPATALGERGVWFGLLAQLVIAVLVAHLLRWTARAARHLLYGTPRCVTVTTPRAAPPLSAPARSSSTIELLPLRRGPPLMASSFSSAGPVIARH